LGNENWFEKLCTVPKIGEITVIRRFEKSSVKKIRNLTVFGSFQNTTFLKFEFALDGLQVISSIFRQKQ